ncbi:MAG TPA: sialate O-acetylesterase [Rhizomicrobium sp.]|nr:sialate O-acetylesterase [Rhizomicrobium sp.]
MKFSEQLRWRLNPSRRAAAVMVVAALFASTLPAEALAADEGAAPVSAITIANYTQGRIFQREKGTYSSFNDGTKTLSISGTYAGGIPTAIVATINGRAYACSITSAADGNWTATIPSVPAGDGYQISIVAAPGAASASQSTTFGIGILFAMIGDSIMNQMGSTSQGPAAADSHARWTQAVGWWPTSADKNGVARRGGNGLVALGNAIRSCFTTAARGNTTPVGFIMGAQGGTASGYWQAPRAAWNRWVAMVTDPDVGGDYEMVLSNLGTSDTDIGQTPGTAPTFLTNYHNLYAQMQAQTGRDTSQLKFGVAFTGAIVNSEVADANVDFVRTGEAAQSAAAGCFWLGSNTDYTHGRDGIHFSAAAYERIGARYAIAICKQYGILPYGNEGPQISGARWAVGSNQLVVDITHLSGGTALKDGDGGTSGAGLIGFTVTSSGGQTISSTAFSGNTILLTMSAIRGNSDTVSLCYCGGRNPWGWTNSGDSIDKLVFDNRASYADDTTGFPLQPTQGGLASPMTVT